MTATVPNTLWACSDSAVETSALDVAAPLRLRATRFAMFAEATPGQQELVRPSNEMLMGSLQAVVDLKERRKPLEELSAERKLQMIQTMTWPYLRSSKELFKGAADLMSMLYRSTDQGHRLLAIALGGMALDLEPFTPRMTSTAGWPPKRPGSGLAFSCAPSSPSNTNTPTKTSAKASHASLSWTNQGALSTADRWALP